MRNNLYVRLKKQADKAMCCPDTEEKFAEAYISKEDISGHFLGKMEGRKKACAMHAKVGRKKNEACTFKTFYPCKQCGSQVAQVHDMRSQVSLNQTQLLCNSRVGSKYATFC